MRCVPATHVLFCEALADVRRFVANSVLPNMDEAAS